MNITIDTRIGTRPYQEDRCGYLRINNRLAMLYVADGHGGDSVSKYIAQHIGQMLPTHCPYLLSMQNECDPQVVRAQFEALFSALNENAPRANEQGSTFVLAVLLPRYIVCGSVGDSTFVVIGPNGEVRATNEHHNLENEQERTRVLKMPSVCQIGCYVMCEHGGLMMTRAIGDHKYGFVTCKPDVHILERDNAKYIAVMSDGITDNMALDKVVELITANHNARSIVNESLSENMRNSGASDNVSMVLLKMT